MPVLATATVRAPDCMSMGHRQGAGAVFQRAGGLARFIFDIDLDPRAPTEQFRARIQRRVPHQQRRDELRRTQWHQPVITPHASGVIMDQGVPGPFALERRIIVKRIEGTVGFAMRAW